jgi:hypothetical protein
MNKERKLQTTEIEDKIKKNVNLVASLQHVL